MSLDLSSAGKHAVANTAWNVIQLASSMSEAEPMIIDTVFDTISSFLNFLLISVLILI